MKEELTAFLPTTRCYPSEKRKLEKEAEENGRSLSAHIRYVLINRKAKK